MAASDEQGFEVAPTRIGGSGDGRDSGRPGGRGPRRERLPIVVVILVALAIPAVAIAGPRIEWRPEIDLSVLRPTPTPVPSPTPRATPSPTPTPLPDLTISAGPLPREPLPIDIGGFRLIDPSTGALGPTGGTRLDTDAVFPAVGGDGWWCVCFRRESSMSDPSRPSETVSVEVGHLDRALGETLRERVVEYTSVAPSVNQDYGVRFDMERSADGRLVYLAVGYRSIDRWTVRVDVIDLARGRLIGGSDVAIVEIPQAEPIPAASGSPSAAASPVSPPAPIETYLGGPMIRLSTDDRELVVFGSIDTYDPSTESGTSRRFAWLADVATDPGADPVGPARPFEAWLAPAMEECWWMTWIAPDELLSTCSGNTPDGSLATVTARSFGVTGRVTAEVSFEMDARYWIADPVIDAANRMLYFWEPTGHVLHRFDLASGRADRLDLDPTMPAPVPAIEPPASRLPDWTSMASDSPLYYAPQLMADPGGSRLYALGIAENPTGGGRGFGYGSTGIWVFDGPAFALVDHWKAEAAYMSMTLTPDGRWLTAVGQAGADAEGFPAGWGNSVTIHDTVNGRVAIQLGDLGEEQVLTLR